MGQVRPERYRQQHDQHCQGHQKQAQEPQDRDVLSALHQTGEYPGEGEQDRRSRVNRRDIHSAFSGNCRGALQGPINSAGRNRFSPTGGANGSASPGELSSPRLMSVRSLDPGP